MEQCQRVPRPLPEAILRPALGISRSLAEPEAVQSVLLRMALVRVEEVPLLRPMAARLGARVE